MRDLASAMTSSSELCFRKALTDMPTRVDYKASSLGWGDGNETLLTDPPRLPRGRGWVPAREVDTPSKGYCPICGT